MKKGYTMKHKVELREVVLEPGKAFVLDDKEVSVGFVIKQINGESKVVMNVVSFTELPLIAEALRN